LNRYQHYKKVVTLDCVEGWSVTILWEGMLVRDLLEEAGPLENAEIVIFHAYDGYTTSLPIDYIINNDLLIAYKMNDVVLPPARGFPFQLVAESKWGYKWIKWITEIEVSDDTSYMGYWERRGYSNSADLDESFFADWST
jgi:DMSO/TMAO reductase YedYZ molybdopterin-dependent catalytic subunit